MRKHRQFIGLLALALGFWQPASVSAAEGFVYTANEDSHSISVIDAGTGQVKNIATPITPHNVQASRDGRLLFAVGPVAGMAAHHSPAKMPEGGEMARGRLLIIDAETLAIESATDIEIGRHPAHVIVDAQGKLAYVTNSEDDTVSVIDVAQKKVVGTIKTGKFPHGLRMSPNGREMYVANVDDNSVSVLDCVFRPKTATVPAGKRPAIRWENGHRSAGKTASIPEQSGQLERECSRGVT